MVKSSLGKMSAEAGSNDFTELIYLVYQAVRSR